MQHVSLKMIFKFAPITALLSLSGCVSETSFNHESSPVFAQTVDQSPIVPAPPIPTPALVPDPVITPPALPPVTVVPPKVICDPFGPGSTSAKDLGLRGKVYYWNGDTTVDRNVLETYQAGHVGANALEGDLYLKSLNIATRDFSLGFTPQGSTDPLKDSSGGILNEYFGIDVKALLAVPENKAGLYEFALIADDGASVTFGDATTPSILLGGGPNKMLCSPSALPLGTAPTKLRVRYFQGPRVRIALQLLWRKVNSNSASDLADAYCGTSAKVFGDDDLFKGGVQQDAFAQLLVRGWEVIPPEFYHLDSGTNPCP